MEAEHKCFPFGAYVERQQMEATVVGKSFRSSSLCTFSSKYNIGFFASYGLSHEKYTHVVPALFFV